MNITINVDYISSAPNIQPIVIKIDETPIFFFVNGKKVHTRNFFQLLGVMKLTFNQRQSYCEQYRLIKFGLSGIKLLCTLNYSLIICGTFSILSITSVEI